VGHSEAECARAGTRTLASSPGVGISGTRYVDIAHVLSEVELVDLSNLMSDYSFLICIQSVPNIDSQSLY
jgi:hypothetical protein